MLSMLLILIIFMTSRSKIMIASLSGFSNTLLGKNSICMKSKISYNEIKIVMLSFKNAYDI